MAAPKTMKGIIFPERGQTALLQEPAPQPEPGKLFCETLFTGLTNGTERNVLMGGNYSSGWPSRCGYQNVGRVIEVGTGAEGWSKGDLLFSGDFCQHVAFFNADPKGLVVKLTEQIEPKHAALFGVASVAMHDVRRAEVKLGERVLVIGAGPIGQLTAQAARASGAHVTIADLNAARLAAARECGVQATIRILSDETWTEIKKGGLFDAIFEDSGAPILDKIIGLDGWGAGLIRPRGRIVLIAGRKEIAYGFNAGQGQELTILHAGHFFADDLHLVARLVAEGAVKIAPIIQEVVKIDQAVEIYDLLRDNPSSLFGTVFDWT